MLAIILINITATVYAKGFFEGGGGGGGEPECSSDSDCDPCGSGDCAGYYKCVAGTCSSTCNTEGNNCGNNVRNCNSYCLGATWCEFSVESTSCQKSCNSEGKCVNCDPPPCPDPTCKCVKGLCGAECERNSECNDNDPGTEDVCSTASCTCTHCTKEGYKPSDTGYSCCSGLKKCSSGICRKSCDECVNNGGTCKRYWESCTGLKSDLECPNGYYCCLPLAPKTTTTTKKTTTTIQTSCADYTTCDSCVNAGCYWCYKSGNEPQCRATTRYGWTCLQQDCPTECNPQNGVVDCCKVSENAGSWLKCKQITNTYGVCESCDPWSSNCYQCCSSDSNCATKDMDNDGIPDTKGKCRCKGCGIEDYLPEEEYTCDWPACETNADCASGFCCTADSSLEKNYREEVGRCVKGIFKDVYLCDPSVPEFVSLSKRSTGFFDLILSFLGIKI